jgi:hypothetical protein
MTPQADKVVVTPWPSERFFNQDLAVPASSGIKRDNRDLAVLVSQPPQGSSRLKMCSQRLIAVL